MLGTVTLGLSMFNKNLWNVSENITGSKTNIRDLTAKIKATIYDYNFYSLIKDIKFIDVEKDVSKKLYQIEYKVKMNSIYGITKEDKQKEKKNEKLVYIEDQQW